MLKLFLAGWRMDDRWDVRRGGGPSESRAATAAEHEESESDTGARFHEITLVTTLVAVPFIEGLGDVRLSFFPARLAAPAPRGGDVGRRLAVK